MSVEDRKTLRKRLLMRAVFWGDLREALVIQRMPKDDTLFVRWEIDNQHLLHRFSDGVDPYEPEYAAYADLVDRMDADADAIGPDVASVIAANAERLENYLHCAEAHDAFKTRPKRVDELRKEGILHLDGGRIEEAARSLVTAASVADPVGTLLQQKAETLCSPRYAIAEQPIEEVVNAGLDLLVGDEAVSTEITATRDPVVKRKLLRALAILRTQVAQRPEDAHLHARYIAAYAAWTQAPSVAQVQALAADVSKPEAEASESGRKAWAQVLTLNQQLHAGKLDIDTYRFQATQALRLESFERALAAYKQAAEMLEAPPISAEEFQARALRAYVTLLCLNEAGVATWEEKLEKWKDEAGTAEQIYVAVAAYPPKDLFLRHPFMALLNRLVPVYTVSTIALPVVTIGPTIADGLGLTSAD